MHLVRLADCISSSCLTCWYHFVISCPLGLFVVCLSCRNVQLSFSFFKFHFRRPYQATRRLSGQSLGQLHHLPTSRFWSKRRRAPPLPPLLPTPIKPLLTGNLWNFLAKNFTWKQKQNTKLVESSTCSNFALFITSSQNQHCCNSFQLKHF